MRWIETAIAEGGSVETHFSAVIVARERGGRPEVLVQPYMWRGRLQQKFPGGMGEEGESPADTAVREARQEVSLEIAARDLTPVGQFARDPGHTKHFFAAVLFSGQPRTETREDNGGEKLLTSEWREVTAELLDVLHRDHRIGLERAIRALAGKMESFYYRARRLGL